MARLRSSLRLLTLGLTTALCGTLASFLLFTHLNAPENPEIGGKRLSEHLYIAYMPAVDAARMQGAASRGLKDQKTSSHLAIQQLGLKCIPLIQEWLTTEPTPLEIKAKSLARRLGFNLPSTDYDKRELACRAAIDLGQWTAPLVPQLIVLTTNGALPNRSLPLDALKAIQIKPPHDREQVVSTLKKQMSEVKAKQGLATKREFDLLNCIISWEPLYGVFNNSTFGKMQNVMSLSEKQKYPHRMLPILMSDLASTNAAVVEIGAKALGNYGALAHAALPLLTNLSQHPKGYVRSAAAKSIQSINLAVSRNEFQSNDTQRIVENDSAHESTAP